MKKLFFCILFLLCTTLSFANIVGNITHTVKPYTDVYLSVPFSQNLQGQYTITAKGTTTISVSGTPFVSGGLKDFFYIRFITSTSTGFWTTITSNTTNQLTIHDPAILAYIKVGDIFRVYKHYTLQEIFPDKMINQSFNAATRIFIYENNLSAPGAQNSSTYKIASYINGSWTGTGVGDNTILYPETQFLVRNNAGTNLYVLTLGDVPDWALTKRRIVPNIDLVIGTGYPLRNTLSNSLLGSQSRLALIYNNATIGINKAAYKTALFNNGIWTGSGVTGSQALLPGTAFTVRLPANEQNKYLNILKPYTLADTGKSISIKNVTMLGSQPWMEITFSGTLQHSNDLTTWNDVVSYPKSPWKTPASTTKFYRAR